MHFVYSSAYIADIGTHVFPIKKYQLVTEALRKLHHIPASAFLEATPASREQLLRVHTDRYLDDLERCRWTARTMQSELPLSSAIVEMFIVACGGTIKTAEIAMEDGVAVHIGGGFHHAFSERAEGFCYLNDLAVAVQEMHARGAIQRAMIIDCDLHQGNGTARIFQNEKSVFTFSMHQLDLYPVKEKSDLDINLDKGTSDAEYLRLLRTHIPDVLAKFEPELILYQAGADPYEGDQLGDLKLTIAGLRERDRLVFQWAKENHIPIAATLGGGYARNTNDTVTIHVNTGLMAWASNQS